MDERGSFQGRDFTGATAQALCDYIRQRAGRQTQGDMALAAAQVGALAAGAGEECAVAGALAVLDGGVEAGAAAGLTEVQAGLAWLAGTAVLSAGLYSDDERQARAGARVIATVC